MFPTERPRRLRRTPALRRLVAETNLAPDDFVAPLFVAEGLSEAREISSLPGQFQHTVDSLRQEVKELVRVGVGGVILFGVPTNKDEEGSGAWDPKGIAQVALRALRDEFGDELVLMADLCLDEYTSHGHCGVLRPDGTVDNDATLELYGRVAVAQAEAGASVVAPSGMMDGQVGAIRGALDAAGFDETIILAYAAKFASGLYGPFRDAVGVEIVGGGDRQGYQQDYRNRREALREARADVAQGADIVMVKPAMSYLDVLSDLRRELDVPLCAYHVSGEYAMVKAAAANGWIDGPAVAWEQLTAVRRAGADFVLTYFARELATELRALTSLNEAWFARAQKVLPGGVDSPVRSFRSVGGTPYTVARGSGAYVEDVDGTRYLDFVQSYGASLLGHAHPAVVAALRDAVGEGTTFGAPTPGEVVLAETITTRVPGLEQVRLVSSGTEALMSVVRLARGITGRDKVVKFDGCYHGHSDALLVAGGSGVAQMGLPDSAGVTTGAVRDTIVAPYNAVPTLDETVAAVLVEPVAANMNLVAPGAGFLPELRAECSRVGALLIFDEVITGFRLAYAGAEEYFGVTPDLWCFGKVIGGGLPVGAFGGSAESMAHLAPLGPVYQAGTLSGNPLATAAGTTVLNLVTPGDYEDLTKRVATFAAAMESAIASSGLAGRCPTQGPLMGLFLSRGPFDAPKDFGEARRLCENGLYRSFFHAMLERGVALAPGAYEILFVSLAHSADDLDATASKAADAAAVVARS